MILTKEIFLQGRSIRGSWSDKQLKLLGVKWPKRQGWISELIGSDVPDANIKKFLNLKDAHLINKETGEIKEKYIKECLEKSRSKKPLFPKFLSKQLLNDNSNVKKQKFSKKSKKRKPKPLVGFWVATQTCGFIIELLKCNQGLNQWEIDFIDKLQYHERFSVKQAALIAKLRQKVFNLGFLSEFLC